VSVLTLFLLCRVSPRCLHLERDHSLHLERDHQQAQISGNVTCVARAWDRDDPTFAVEADDVTVTGGGYGYTIGDSITQGEDTIEVTRYTCMSYSSTPLAHLYVIQQHSSGTLVCHTAALLWYTCMSYSSTPLRLPRRKECLFW
jgi:hypothetical protein